MQYLLDTNIIIKHIDKLKDVRRINNLYISYLTVAELVKGINSRNYYYKRKTLKEIDELSIRIDYSFIQHIMCSNDFNALEVDVFFDLKCIVNNILSSDTWEIFYSDEMKSYMKYFEDFIYAMDATLFKLCWFVRTASRRVVRGKDEIFHIQQLYGKNNDIPMLAKQAYTEYARMLFSDAGRKDPEDLKKFNYMLNLGYKKTKSKTFWKLLSYYTKIKFDECLNKDKSKESKAVKAKHLQPTINEDGSLNDYYLNKRNDAVDLMQSLYLTKQSVMVTDDKKILPFYEAENIKVINFKEFCRFQKIPCEI